MNAFSEMITERLTPCELEVLRQIAEGLTDPEIAARQGVSRRTIQTHHAKIYKKLGIRGTALVTQLAVAAELKVLPEITDGDNLTIKQKLVAILLCSGFSNKEAAVYLNLGRRTIETHRERAFKKFGARNIAQFTTAALSRNIVPNWFTSPRHT